jgi:alkylated DNA nucleotide flippase Atl1
VVNSRGAISFKPGSRQYQAQKSRLEAEGVVFIKGRFSMTRYGWKP